MHSPTDVVGHVEGVEAQVLRWKLLCTFYLVNKSSPFEKRKTKCNRSNRLWGTKYILTKPIWLFLSFSNVSLSKMLFRMTWVYLLLKGGLSWLLPIPWLKFLAMCTRIHWLHTLDTFSCQCHTNNCKKHSSKRLKIAITCDCCLISWTWDCAYSLACIQFISDKRTKPFFQLWPRFCKRLEYRVFFVLSVSLEHLCSMFLALCVFYLKLRILHPGDNRCSMQLYYCRRLTLLIPRWERSVPLNYELACYKISILQSTYFSFFSICGNHSQNWSDVSQYQFA